MKNNLRWIAPATLVLTLVASVVVWRGAASPNSAAPASTADATAGAALAVSTTTPLRQTWPTQLLASGNLAAWQEAIVGAQTGSLRIAELYVDVGQPVKRGQLLARLADDSLKASLDKQNAAIATARANLEQARANVLRARAVSGSGAISGKSIDDYVIAEATSQAALASAQADLRGTQIQLEQTRIVAVDDGYVSSRSALLGNVVAAGSELFRLVRQSRIEWHAEVDAQRVSQVHVGQVVRVLLPDGSVSEGRVRLVAPTLSTSTNRATVYVALPAGSGAAPGMFASGTIEGEATAALTLPQSAVVPRDGRNDVYLLKDDSTVTRRTVVTGRRQGDRIEVLSGLPADARVVASGGAFLAEGVKVERIERLAASDGAARPSAR
jgi:RND family efflux transporter MFP subunit